MAEECEVVLGDAVDTEVSALDLRSSVLPPEGVSMEHLYLATTATNQITGMQKTTG